MSTVPMSTAMPIKKHLVLSDETWSTINAALSDEQRTEFNRWQSRLGTLASDILNDVSFFQDWIELRKKRGESDARGLMPQTPYQADEMARTIGAIPWLGG